MGKMSVALQIDKLRDKQKLLSKKNHVKTPFTIVVILQFFFHILNKMCDQVCNILKAMYEKKKTNRK